MVRLAALAVFVAEDAERLAARLRLSNAEQAVLALGAADHAETGLPDEEAAKRSALPARSQRLCRRCADRLGRFRRGARRSKLARGVRLARTLAGAIVSAARLRHHAARRSRRTGDRRHAAAARSGMGGRRLRLVARGAARARGFAQPKITQARPISVAAKARTTGTSAISINTSRPLSVARRETDLAGQELAHAGVPGRPARVGHAERSKQQEQREEDREEQRHDRKVDIDPAAAGKSEPGHGEEPEHGGEGDFYDDRVNARFDGVRCLSPACFGV